MAAKFRGYKPQPPKQVQLSPALQQKFQQALALHQKGMTTQAQNMCEEILKVQPKHFDTLYLLGVSMSQTGQLKKAEETLSAAIKLNTLHPAAYNNHGVVLMGLERLEEAIASYNKAISLKRDYANAFYNRGVALATLKRLDEAISSYDEAINLKPDYAKAHDNRGNALKELNRLDEAIISYDRAISLKPDYADAFYNRGVTLLSLNRLDEAIDSYDKAISLKPNYAEAYYNRGVTLATLRRFDKALASYDKAISLKPDYAEAYYNRGNALKDLNQLDEAIASYDKAISLKPDYPEAYNNRGNVLGTLRRLDEAIASYDKAISLKPDYEWLPGFRLHTLMKLCSWRDLTLNIDILANSLKLGERVSPPFAILGLFDNPTINRHSSEICANAICKPTTSRTFPVRTTFRQKLRIGYYSADFHNHATLYLMAELFEQHNKLDYELHGFSFGPTKNDAIRQRILPNFSSFQDVQDKSDRDIAELSRHLGIDIAVDLKGYTTDARPRLFAERCAPIQVNYIGYPGTMGTDHHDYIIADHTLIPHEKQQFYSEKVVYLPYSYQVNDSKRRISDRTFSRQELGLPENGFVFCCFNNSWKILPDRFSIWMRLLKAVDGSILWLLEDNATAAKNLRKEAANRDVDPQRLVFAKRMPVAEHLARHRYANLFLDTLPCNAHTTASDALWAGLPVLTQIGQSFAARVAASLLNAMDLSDLIAQSPDEYEAKAIDLALNPGKLAAIKAKIAANRQTSALFDAKMFARHIEAAYREMIRRYDAGLKPEVIEVSKDGIATSPDM